MAFSSDSDLTLRDLVRSNAEALSAIRSIVIDAEADIEIVGPSPVERYPRYRFSWTWQNGETKMQQCKSGPRGRAGAAAKTSEYQWVFREFYNGKKGYRVLEGCNPEEPTPILTESDGRELSGTVDSRQPDPYVGVDPHSTCLWKVGLLTQSWTLAEFVNTHQSSLSEFPSVQNGGCYEIDVRFVTDIKNFPFNKDFRFKIAVDPAFNCLVRRIECTNEDRSVRFKNEVLSFGRYQDGVCVPTRVRSENYNSFGDGEAGVIHYVNLNVRQVNQPIDASAFVVNFPDWLRVLDARSGEMVLWGSNGPLRVIGSRKELIRWERKNTWLRISGRLWIAAALSLLLLVGGLAWFAFRRRCRTC